MSQDDAFVYAWCFEHGTMHRFFAPKQWCTARWIPFHADTAKTAQTAKQERFGDAQFIDQLPQGQQLEVIREAKARREARDEAASATGVQDTDSYAWCFGHGHLHIFSTKEPPHCTSFWVELTGATEAAALADKDRRYGAAQFIDQLPLSEQVVVHDAHSAREG